MIAEGLFAIALAAQQPQQQHIHMTATPRVRYYKRIKIKKKQHIQPAMPAVIVNQGPTLVRSLNCYTVKCSTFDEMWQERIMQWSQK